MEKMSILTEYENECNELRNRLFQIRQKFEFLKGNLKVDYDKGLVSKSDYQRLIALPIDGFIESPYSLSYEEVEFVKKYAELNSHGEIMACLLKQEYLAKLDVLRKLYRSIEIFSFYDKMTLEQRKEYFLSELSKRHDEGIVELRGNIQNGKQYLDELLLKQQNTVNNCSLDQLNSCIEHFYDIDYSFYEWFLKMSLKDEYDSGFIFGEHVENSSKISNRLKDLDFNLVEHDKLLKEYFELMNSYVSFTEGIVSWRSNRKKSIFKRKLNIEDYYELFKKVSYMPSALKYFDKYMLESNDVIDIKNCFDVYNKENYQFGLDGISEEDYVRTLFKNILLYFKNKLDILKSKLMNIQSEFGSVQKDLSVLSIKNINGAKLENDIFMNLDSLSNLAIPNFDSDELRTIYEDLVAIVYGKNDSYPNEGFKK